jgi:hypothetical protein
MAATYKAAAAEKAALSKLMAREGDAGSAPKHQMTPCRGGGGGGACPDLARFSVWYTADEIFLERRPLLANVDAETDGAAGTSATCGGLRIDKASFTFEVAEEGGPHHAAGGGVLHCGAVGETRNTHARTLHRSIAKGIQ